MLSLGAFLARLVAKERCVARSSKRLVRAIGAVLIGALIGASIASCGGPPRARRAGTLSARRPPPRAPERTPCAGLVEADGPRACVTVSLDADANALEVRLALDPEALPQAREDVRLRFREAQLGDGYVERAIEREGGWPDSLGAVREVTELRYRVRLDEPPRAGASWRRPGGWHLSGASFLPDVLVDDVPVDVPVVMEIDVGDAPLRTAAGTEQRVFDARSVRRLADEAYEIGPLTTTQREVLSTTLVIATSGDEGEARLDEIADEIARVVTRVSARLGPPSTDAALIVFHAVEEGGFAARRGASVVHAEGVPEDARYGLARAGVHELGHLWIPGTHEIPEEYFAEGVTDFVAALTLASLTDAPREALARVVLRRHARYEAGAGTHTLLAPREDDPSWVVDAGLVTAFCLDAHLTESGSSLAAVLATTLSRDESEIGTEALLADLASVSGSAASHLEAMAANEGAFAIDGCLERFGFHTRQVSWDGWSNEELGLAVLGGVREARGFDAVSGLEIVAVEEGSPFAEGDVLTRVGEHAVGALEDVAWAVRDHAEGATVSIEYRRDGEAHRVERAVPPQDPETRIPRTYVELVPVTP